jgi:hypothetical protein
VQEQADRLVNRIIWPEATLVGASRAFSLRCPEGCDGDRQKETYYGREGADKWKPVFPALRRHMRLGPSHRLYFCPKDRLVKQIAFPGLQPLQGDPVGGEGDDGFTNIGNGAVEDTADV